METLTLADKEAALSPQDLELLADAYWWAGRPEESVQALERAFGGYVESGRPAEAASVASLLAYLAMRRLAVSIAFGWHSKAMRLLEDQPESRAHAYLKMLETAQALLHDDDLERTIELADETIELARRTMNRDAESQALVFKGSALVSSGMWREGLALIDEASASVLSGDLSLRSASDVYCTTISACRSLADYRRAGEWTDEANRWMSQNSVGGYPGVCQVHRAELKRLKGSWSEAEQEVRDACVELERYHILDGVGFAYGEVGEIRLLMGDLSGAEAAFNRAFEFGFESQPGLALLMLAKGQVDEAAHSLERSLSEGAGNQGRQRDLLTRARLLPAQVKVALVRDDLDTAQVAADEMEQIAAEFDRPAFEANHLTANGEIALYLGNPEAALPGLDRAWRLWRELDFPYESARARFLLGRAHHELGEEAVALMELNSARSVFERLGAKPDVRQVDLITHPDRSDVHRNRVETTFLFTDIVTSTDLIGLIGDGAWESLLAWHDRELRSLFAEHGGVEANHTGDGFFVTFDRGKDAVDAAVAIQRRLSDHRLEHGFAPSVRIGIHSGEATLDGGHYRGQAVHLAARVAAAAGAEEILSTDDTISTVDAVGYPISEARLVDLKGIKDPVQVHTVSWR